MMKRRDVISLIGGSMVLPFGAKAEEASSIDAALAGAVERGEMSGVVAMATNRSRSIRACSARRTPQAHAR